MNNAWTYLWSLAWSIFSNNNERRLLELLKMTLGCIKRRWIDWKGLQIINWVDWIVFIGWLSRDGHIIAGVLLYNRPILIYLNLFGSETSRNETKKLIIQIIYSSTLLWFVLFYSLKLQSQVGILISQLAYKLFIGMDLIFCFMFLNESHLLSLTFQDFWQEHYSWLHNTNTELQWCIS